MFQALLLSTLLHGASTLLFRHSNSKQRESVRNQKCIYLCTCICTYIHIFFVLLHMHYTCIHSFCLSDVYIRLKKVERLCYFAYVIEIFDIHLFKILCSRVYIYIHIYPCLFVLKECTHIYNTYIY